LGRLGLVALAVAAGGVTAGILALRRRVAIVTVSGCSMEPALAPGDKILVRRTGLSELHTGDIVVIEQPSLSGGWTTRPARWPPRHQSWIIKRVAALPGELRPDRLLPAATQEDDPTVPERSFVVLGDNLESSYDSRRIGYIPSERLLGTMIRRLRQ
jgi:signal peptidase I